MMAPKRLLFLIDVKRRQLTASKSRSARRKSQSCPGCAEAVAVAAAERQRAPQTTATEIANKENAKSSRPANCAPTSAQHQQLAKAASQRSLQAPRSDRKQQETILRQAKECRQQMDKQRRLHTILREQLDRKKLQRAIKFDQLISCPSSASLLYSVSAIVNCCLLLLLVAMLAGVSLAPSSAALQVSSGGGGGRQLSPLATIDWPQIGSQLLRHFGPASLAANRDRWVTLGVNNQNTRDQYRPTALLSGGGASLSRRPWLQQNQLSRLARAWDSLRNRLGARNSIRVHNAFRDLAWRILSRLSMPTPVIYELRRQNFYPPEEDTLNDLLFDKNTTKTIRTKRQLRIGDRLRSAAPEAPPGAAQVQRRATTDDDDDEDDSFRERIRMRLEDLFNLSRRSLFGRVVRLPSVFAFKRQQEDTIPLGGSSGDASKSTRHKSGPKQASRSTSRRKRRRDSDRQMITINGKQYYVDDDGELKELKELP